MANNKVTVDVKCDGKKTQVQLVKDKDEDITIFVLRQFLQKEHSKKYPVVLYKKKKVPKLKDPIPTDSEELDFISKIDIKTPQGDNVSYDLTKTVAEVMKEYTKPGLKCVLITGSRRKIEKSDDKLSKIYKPGRVLTLKVFKSAKYKCRIEPMTLNIGIEVEIDKEGTVKDLVNEALEMYNHEEFDIECSGFDPYQHIEVRKGLELVGLEAKLDTLKEDTEVNISYKHDPSESEKIKTMKRYTSLPSDYGKENEWRNLQLAFRKVPICDHREGRVGDDVTLYYPEFQQFIDNCNGMIKPSKSDFCFAKEVCDEMSKYFSSEKERETAFAKAIKKYLKQELGKNDVVQSESGQSEPDIVISPNSCVIMEVKNESGQGGGSDSHSQVIAYYVQSLEEKKPDQCPAPAYLIELVGPQLTISGAVYGRYVFVDKLIDPVWLVTQHNEEAIFKIARIFKALKEAYGKIQQYYEKNTKINNPRLPAYEPFNKGTIQYTSTLMPHMYEGTYKKQGATMDVIIRFLERYSIEAHMIMSSQGHAPQIISEPKIHVAVEGTRYQAIVLEKIDYAIYVDTYLRIARDEVKDIRDNCVAAIKKLHKKGFCYEKPLLENICFNPSITPTSRSSKEIFILNYEWARKKDDTEYPFSDAFDQEQELKELMEQFKELK